MDYSVRVIRSNRKTLSLEIREPGVLLARAPLRMSDERILTFVNEKDSWIREHMLKVQTATEKRAENLKFSQQEIIDMAEEAVTVFPEVVKNYAQIMGVTYGRITIRHQKTRWGSCSSKGNLNFNCLLMRAPREVLEYVVVHELAHRKEMNHSKKFWDIVEKYKPDYKACKQWLNEEGSKLIN